MDLPASPAEASPVSVVPVRVKSLGMWVAFLFLIYFISLYFLATAVGNILHEGINRFIADPLEAETVKRSAYFSYFFGNFKQTWLRINLSTLLVSFPVFMFLHVYILRLGNKNFEVFNFRARKALIYLTLVGAFIFSTYEIIKIVYDLLSGSINSRVLAHFGVTFVIVLAIFVYYLFWVKEDIS